MDRTKRIFISDIHLGDDPRYDDPVPNRRARFSPDEHRERLLNFLHKQVLTGNDDVKDRVYVNSGSWCGKQAHCVVVEPGDDGKTAASLLAIDSAGEIVKDKGQKLQV